MRRALALDPAYAEAHSQLGWILFKMGEVEDGVSEAELAARLSNDCRIIARLAHLYAIVGRTSDVKELLQTLELQAREQYVSLTCFAYVYAGLEERDLAFARLDDAYRVHDPALSRLRAEPLLLQLHDDPRFSQLARRMNLP